MDIDIKKTSDSKSALKIAHNSKDYFEAGFDQLKNDLDNHLLYGAYKKDSMVGFITYKEINPEVVEIIWLAVDPENREKGVGSKLVKETLSKFRNIYKICEVKTLAETADDEGYTKTRNFYRNLGFIPLEIIDPYPGWDKNNPCQIFVKPLR